MSRAALSLLLLLAACASGQGAPISYGGADNTRREPVSNNAPGAPRVEYRGGRPVQAESEPAPPAPRPVVEQEAPDWADGEGTPLSRYALQPGEAQPFDPARPPRTHRVAANETLYDIASTYQVPLRALIDQNNLEPPYALSAGRELQLPPPRFHTVARSESFEDVARRYNVDPRSLALLNRMQAPYRVRAGDRLVLPAMARPIETPAAEPVPAAQPLAPLAPGSGRFAWPLRGDVVARYGAQPNGQRLDGIEIAGEEGDPILAAADGDVVYAGADLPAYGTLVLVRHPNNYVTAYGHARRALVREGQRVRAGQPIAELGPRTEGRPRLLFQVRQGRGAVDPAPLLGR